MKYIIAEGQKIPVDQNTGKTINYYGKTYSVYNDDTNISSGENVNANQETSSNLEKDISDIEKYTKDINNTYSQAALLNTNYKASDTTAQLETLNKKYGDQIRAIYTKMNSENWGNNPAAYMNADDKTVLQARPNVQTRTDGGWNVNGLYVKHPALANEYTQITSLIDAYNNEKNGLATSQAGYNLSKAKINRENYLNALANKQKTSKAFGQSNEYLKALE